MLPKFRHIVYPLRRLTGCLVALAILSGQAAQAQTSDGVAALARLIWTHNPEVRQARFAVQEARTELLRLRPLANPTVDLGTTGVPVGPQPAGIDWLNAPAASLELVQPFDLGKRPLRLDRAEAGVQHSRWQLLDLYHQRTADLLAVQVRLAATQLRLDLLGRQVASVQELARITGLSAREGFSPPLDREKLEVEIGRIQQLHDAAQLERDQVIAEWSRLVLDLPPPLSSREAQALMTRLAALPSSWPDAAALVDQAPARRILTTQKQQAAYDGQLANLAWLPDIGLKLAYTYDSLAGNPPHSLSGGLTAELPVWQAGEADRQSASLRQEALTSALRTQQDVTLQQARALERRMTTLARMLAQLQDQRLPAANATLQRLETALKARGLPLTDVIQVRQSVLDLESDRLDLLEHLGMALVDYRRLLAWDLPDPEDDPS